MKSLVILSLIGAFSMIAVAGDLNPPGPPSSTMKTLDEVEPRIPIPGSDSPAADFTIDQSGLRGAANSDARTSADDVERCWR